MSNSAWKDLERHIAREYWRRVYGEEGLSEMAGPVEGIRPGATGRATPDVLVGGMAVEAKLRAGIASSLIQMMSQAEANAPEGLFPTVVLHKKGQQHKRNLVIMREEHFLKILRGEKT